MLWALLGFSVVVLALTSAFHAILRTRTAQGAMAWLVALFSMPILAIPLYWLFGRRHFAGYTQIHSFPTRRSSDLPARRPADRKSVV